MTVDQAPRHHRRPDAGGRRGGGGPGARAQQGLRARRACSTGLTPGARQRAARAPPTSCSIRRGVARSTVAPAVLSLILVALVLLSRLLAAAMGLRRGELALASLRGYSRRQLWFLGMLEPLLILAAGHPARRRAGLPRPRACSPGAGWCRGCRCRSCWPAGWPSLGVVLVTGLVAALVVRDAVNEPLSAQIAGVRRPATCRPRRWSIVRLALVAAAVAALVTAASRSQPQGPGRHRPGPADAAGGRGRSALRPARAGRLRAVGPLVRAAPRAVVVRRVPDRAPASRGHAGDPPGDGGADRGGVHRRRLAGRLDLAGQRRRHRGGRPAVVLDQPAAVPSRRADPARSTRRGAG